MIRTLIANAELDSSEGRHETMDAIMESRIGKVIRWLPMILILILANKNEYAAVWSAWGTSLLGLAIGFYRNSYNPMIPRVNILAGGSKCFFFFFEIPNLNKNKNEKVFVGYTSLLIYSYAVKWDYNYRAINPTVLSVLFVTVVFTALIGHSFIEQAGRYRVSPEVAATDGYKKLVNFLTVCWSILFFVVALCAWLGLGLTDPGSTGYTILSVVVPITLIVLGALLTPIVAEHLKKKAGIDDDSLKPPQAAEEQEPFLKP